jgi:hypothetical protein
MGIMLFRNPLPFDSPAAYQIRVQGRIDPTWSDRLEGMTISVCVVAGATPITTLEGELSDQASLAGVLNSLYNHLVVLSVERLSSRENGGSRLSKLTDQEIAMLEVEKGTNPLFEVKMTTIKGEFDHA